MAREVDLGSIVDQEDRREKKERKVIRAQPQQTEYPIKTPM